MLEHLFGSRTRLKLLHLFYEHPEDAFFVRELTRKIETQINAVRREIQNLVEVGMLLEGGGSDDAPVSKRPGVQRRYYKVNVEFPLYQEIRSLLLKAKVFLEYRLDSNLMKLGDVKYLAFLGQFLGLRQQPVDLFIVGSLDEHRLRSTIDDVGKKLGWDINYTCLTPEDFKYRKEIADRFVSSILQSPKHVVVNRIGEGGLR